MIGLKMDLMCVIRGRWHWLVLVGVGAGKRFPIIAEACARGGWWPMLSFVSRWAMRTSSGFSTCQKEDC